MVRLDKMLCDAGVGTRSEVKKLIRQNRVRIPGMDKLSAELHIDETAVVYVDGKQISSCGKVYYMLNKPAGILSATEDKNETTVVDCLSAEKVKDLFPVGRLDKDTVGLLLLTNDGELAHYLLSPGRHVDKSYYVRLAEKVSVKDAGIFKEGIEFKDFKSLPAVLERIVNYPDYSIASENEETKEAIVTIHEGKFHQIKRMFNAVNNEVMYLKRISFGSLKLDPSLKEGEYRKLTEEELLQLKDDIKKHNSGE